MQYWLATVKTKWHLNTKVLVNQKWPLARLSLLWWKVHYTKTIFQLYRKQMDSENWRTWYIYVEELFNSLFVEVLRQWIEVDLSVVLAPYLSASFALLATFQLREELNITLENVGLYSGSSKTFEQTCPWSCLFTAVLLQCAFLWIRITPGSLSVFWVPLRRLNKVSHQFRVVRKQGSFRAK